MNELIGKVIAGLRVNEDQSLLVFDHPDGTSTSYETDGGCCSETWFADITGVASLIGAKVVEVESVELPDTEDGRCRQDYDTFYGIKLRTDKGYVDIVYRNSSNGHYGGSISLYLRPELPAGLVPISADWSA